MWKITGDKYQRENVTTLGLKVQGKRSDTGIPINLS
jgi:hypothetical protein